MSILNTLAAKEMIVFSLEVASFGTFVIGWWKERVNLMYIFKRYKKFTLRIILDILLSTIFIDTAAPIPKMCLVI